MSELESYRQRLKCNSKQLDDVFAGCVREALGVFSAKGFDLYLEGIDKVCALGRGPEIPVIFADAMPSVARSVGEAPLAEIIHVSRRLGMLLPGKALGQFLATLPACARRLNDADLLEDWLTIAEQTVAKAKEGFQPLLENIDFLLGQLTIGGLKRWISFGVRTYRSQPHRYPEYFGLATADSRAAMQRERHGTLFRDQERKLDLFQRALFGLEDEFHPYSITFSEVRKPMPYLDKEGFHLVDVYDDLDGISGLDRYRAALAHLAAHRLWSTPFIADNFNRYQQMIIETLEDSRVEWLAMQRFPGLRALWMRLHPIPRADACPKGWSCIRHYAVMLSRALLDPNHGYTDPRLLDTVAEFHRRMAENPLDTKVATELGVRHLVKIHEVDFRSPKVFFDNTEINYRDDNRYLWIFLEDTNDEDDFHSDHSTANPLERQQTEGYLFAAHQPEWDYLAQNYRPDWATVFETIHPNGDARVIDRLLEHHNQLAKQIKRIVDLLKPQQKIRIRFQEEGDELDLDVALRSVIDYRSGSTPDPRIHYSHEHAGRDIAVTLLLDLSESIREVPEGAEVTTLQLSQEAVSLLGWAIDAMGDPFSIVGFSSNSRHEVRFQHIKGFGEEWGDTVKGRLAAMEGSYSTRMGAALRRAGHYLEKRKNQKKLLLLLTDGEPYDVDAHDPEYLKEDTRKAVDELTAKGITTYCITLDPKADDYVQYIFGKHYSVVDRVERLPERLPRLFMSLTK